MSSLTSIELNYLVFRYLQESGFTHSAFGLGYEAGINESPVDGNLVPPGALIKLVQKGLQYLEMEVNLSDVFQGDADVDQDFSFLQPLDLITKEVHELQQIVKEKKANIQKQREKDKGKVMRIDRERERELKREKKKVKQEKEREHERDSGRIEKNKERDKEKQREKYFDSGVCVDKVKIKCEDSSGGPEPMDISMSLPCLHGEVPSSDVTLLQGHTSEVFACAWNPVGSLLASVSGDSTARIWTIVDGPCGSNRQNGALNELVLEHSKGRSTEKANDVTTLDWNGEGTFLATGSYDGQARIWSRDGELRGTFNKHRGPIFSLKWNKEGNYLLSGSVDKTAIVWDVKTGKSIQQFDFHSAPTLDVDWRNNVSFATCSTDAMINVCKLGERRPLKTFSGHQGEVNAIKWDPTGSLLASCSDDGTAKIWSMKQDKYVHNLTKHAKEIYTIRWSPTGPGTSNPNQSLLLASASFDSTIKLWDVELGGLRYSFNAHREPVYSVAFSPNAEYLASGSLDKCIHIWSVKEGRIVKTYKGSGSIFEVCWNKEGNKIAACFANSIVCVVDLRM